MPGARLCRVVGLQLGLQISSIRVARGSAANTAEMLERAGVVFIAADERGGPGVRLREPRRSLVRAKSENQSN